MNFLDGPYMFPARMHLWRCQKVQNRGLWQANKSRGDRDRPKARWWRVVTGFFQVILGPHGIWLYNWRVRRLDTFFSEGKPHVSASPKATSQESREIFPKDPVDHCHRKWNKQVRSLCVTLGSWTAPFWIRGDDISHSRRVVVFEWDGHQIITQSSFPPVGGF